MGNMSRLLCFMDIMRNSGVENGDREKVLALRIANGLKVLAYCDEFEKKGFTEKIVDALCKEKLLFAASIKTKGDEKELWKGPRMYSNGNELVPVGKYHSEAEELLIWSEVSHRVPLSEEAVNRMSLLFHKYFGESSL